MPQPPDEESVDMRNEWLAHPYTRRVLKRIEERLAGEHRELALSAAVSTTSPARLRIVAGIAQGLSIALDDMRKDVLT